MTPIVRQIRELKDKNTAELRELWLDYFGGELPPYRHGFLRKAIAYRIQELTYGGLSKEAEKQIDDLVNETKGIKSKRKKTHAAMPVTGTCIVREWRGERYEVIVLADGFEYDGRQWNSLSTIARHITGTNWNGPMFFGLRRKKTRA